MLVDQSKRNLKNIKMPSRISITKPITSWGFSRGTVHNLKISIHFYEEIRTQRSTCEKSWKRDFHCLQYFLLLHIFLSPLFFFSTWTFNILILFCNKEFVKRYKRKSEQCRVVTHYTRIFQEVERKGFLKPPNIAILTIIYIANVWRCGIFWCCLNVYFFIVYRQREDSITRKFHLKRYRKRSYWEISS